MMEINCGNYGDRSVTKESSMRAHSHTRKSWKRLVWKKIIKKCFMYAKSDKPNALHHHVLKKSYIQIKDFWTVFFLKFC